MLIDYRIIHPLQTFIFLTEASTQIGCEVVPS